MKVCIAEKPSVAREIAQVLGARTRQDGYFEGNGYSVTWTFGHFCTLKVPEDYNPTWKRWDLNSLPMLPEKFETKLISNKGVKKQFGVIKKLLKSAELVINCGDAGQEGELIQRWVLKEAKYKGRVLRLWISSLTTEAIRDGFQQLQPASNFDNLYYAGSSRAIGDWLLGMNATRLYTLKYGGYKQVLSIGRVQTPTLAMLVERYKEIENFKPEPYWELHTLYRDVDFHYEKGKFQKKEEGAALLQQVTGHPFSILSFTKKKGKEYPPYLFDLTSLQVHCNKRFGLSAEQTLQTVQKLYEQKVVTYPRVDTSYLPNDVYPKIPGILKKMNQYSQFTQSLLGNPIRKSSKVFNDKKVTDHHAIIPTGMEKTLIGREQQVYDSIARRFIAAFYPDCIVSHTTVIGEAAGVKFKATGKEILEEGWRVLYPKKTGAKGVEEMKNRNNKTEDNVLPTFTKGETGPHEPALVEKMTQPPKHYTEATLLRAMETAGKKVEDEELRQLMKSNGIGRPSTRANIIETLFKRKYIHRQKKLILATETGIQLIDTIQNELLKSAELTGQWEKQLREMEAGNYSALLFVNNMKDMVSKLIDEVRIEKSVKRISSVTLKPDDRRQPNKRNVKTPSLTVAMDTFKCPKCYQGKLLKGKTAYGCSRWKEGCTFRLPFVFMEKKIPEKQLIRLMKKGSTIQLKGFIDNGEKKNGHLHFIDNHELKLEIQHATTKSSQTKTPRTQAKSINPLVDNPTCPKCQKGQIIKGKTAYGCTRWKEGCNFRVEFASIREKAAGKPLTKELVMNLLASLKV